MKNKLFTRLVLSSMALGLAVNQGRANPLGGSVAAGGATISGEGTAITTIIQTTDRAIINWQDFSIGLGELTRFIQPGADAAVLNRVLSGSPSQLLGTLQANGQVYLINPNGILVGPSGQINAATFVGSTLDVANGSFLSGGNMQFLGSTTAGVENLGTINALGGDIFLFGHTVKNSGTLNAGGTAGLAAGVSIELRQAGNERIGVLLGNSAAPAETGVDNQGLVQATSVEINAAGGNIYAVAINNGGTVRAQPTLTMEGGKLVLKSVGGTVINSGTLDASNGNGKGGDIVVAGDKVSLRDGSVVNASGSTGGGSVKIGGGFQGNDASVVNASKTFVGTGASILADATTVGDGGTVIVWSDEVTRFGGSISAKGGALGGNGGFAEVSGKSLIFSGTVDLTAAAGNIGTLLLDPVQIQIAATDFNPVAANDEFAENPASPVVFANTTINALLNGANVTLQANSDIYIDNAINAAGIGDLTLQAGRSVFINADITLNGSFSATANDTAALAANRAVAPFADGGITMGGTVSINTSATGGNITLNVLTGAGGGFDSGDIIVNNLNAGAGHVFLNNAGATAGSDVLMANGTSLITAGSVALNAANGNIGSGATPVRLASTIVEANASGTVDIFATGNLQIGGATLGSLTGITAGGALSVTAQGNITQTELITASAAATFTVDTANPADVLLASAANDFGGAITVTEANGGVVRDIAIRNVNATPAYPTFTIAGTIRNLTLIFDNADLTLPATTITGNLVATSGTGLIAQSGTLIVPGTTTLSANSTITLNDAANDFTGAVASTSGGNTSLTDVNAIVLGTSSVGGNLTVNAGTGITQTGILTVTGTSSFTDAAGNDDIILTQANLFTGAVSASGMNVSITDANGLVLGNVTVGGDLSVLATLGDITTDAASTGIIVTGNSSFTADGAGASITLGDADNNFTGGVSIAGAGGLANVTIFDSTDLVLNAVSVTGTLTVTATGITQSGVITVGGLTTLNGGAAAINLATQNNDFNSVTASNTSDLSLNDINDIVLGAITLTGNLTVNSGLTGVGVTGNISQTGILDVDGTSAFNVNGANLSDVLLASQANDFTGAVTITEVGAGNIRDIELRNVSGTAAVPVFPTGLRNLSVIFNNTSIDLSATTLTGTLTVDAGGAITDNGALVVAGTTTLTAGAANNITLDTAGNDFNTVSVVSGNNVTLVDTDDIDLGASTISGTLSVTGNGAITDSGNVTVAGATTTLFAGPGNNITLDSTGNDFNTVLVTIANNVTLVDTDNIDFGASTILGSLNVTAGGAITDSGTVSVVGGTTTLAAGAANNITLDQAGNNFNTVVITSGNDVTLVDANSIDLGASTVTGTLNVTAAGNITDSGNVTVGGTTTLSAGAVITLDQAGNDFNTVVITTGNNVTLVDTDDIDLGASTVTGTLNVTANGAITDSGNVTATGTTTLAAGAANGITLNSAGNDFNTVVITTGNNVTLVDTDDIDLGASTISGTLSVTANGAVTDSGNVTVAGASATFAAGAANNITLDSAGNDFNTVLITTGNNVSLVDTDDIDLGASTISGTLSVTASGAITDSGNVTVAGATATFAAGAANDITLNSAGNDFNTVIITTGNNVTLVDTDNIDLGASTISGTLSVTANGAITDSGNVTVAGATATFTAGANDITLDSAGNDFNAVTVVSGANVTIIDVDDISFSASASLTSVAITGAPITLPAGITTSGAQTYTGAVLIGSDMTLSSTGGGNLNFSSTINSSGSARDLTLSTSGQVNITGAVGGTLALDVFDIRANVINFSTIVANTSVTLRPFTAGTAIGIEDAGQAFNLTDAELDGITSPLVTIGDSTAGAITTSVDASVTLGYGITLVNNSSVTFGANTFSTTGNLTVNANGAITDASGATITVGGLATFNAGAANSITLGDNGGDTINFGTLTVNGNNVTITEDSAMNFAGTSTVAGNLAATTQAGNLIQDASSSITVTGNANFAAAVNISIGENASTTASFGTLTFSGVNANIFEDGDMLLTGVSSVAGLFNLQSIGGDITDDATASTTAGAVASFIGGGDIIIGDTGTDLFNAGLIRFQKNGAGTVSITEDSSTEIRGAVNFSGGSLTITSAGDITDEAGVTISVADTATFTANAGAGNITLGDDGGDTVNFGSLTVVGNNVVITEDSSTLLTGVNTVNGFLTLTSASHITDASGVTLNVTGLANFNATAGNITLGDQGGDAVTFGSLTFNTTGGAVAITEDDATILTGTSTGDSLTLVSSGTITDNAGTSITIDNGNASITGTAITLADNDGDVLSVSGTAIFNAGAGLINVGTGATTASTLFGKLTFNTTGGAVTITEDDATILAGTSTGDSLVLISAGSITDDAATSVTIDNGNASFTGTGITLADNDGDVLSVSLAASFNSGAGSISVGQGSTANVNFGSLTLNGVNATVTEDSATEFTGGSVLAGFLTLVSNGAITDDANADISVTGATSFTATSADITIGDNGPNNDDNFGSLTLNGANATVVEDDGTDFTGSSTLTGNLTLTSAGAITDQSGVTIDVTGTASFNAGAANITLGDNGGDTIHFGKLLFNTTAGAVTITEDSATIITGPFNTADSLTLISAGSITDDSGVSIIVDAGDASFTGTSIQLADDNGDTLTVSGTASFNAGAGTIVVGVGGTANTMFGKLNFNTTSAGVTVFEDDATILTGINTGDSLLITSAGSITDDPNTSVTIDAGNAELTGTSISLADNAGDVFSVGNGISILNANSGPGDITLAAAGTVTLGGITVNGVNATIFADSAASFVGSSTLTGFLSLTTAGDIADLTGVTISVTGNANFNAVGGQITLGDQGSDTVDFGSLTVNGLTANITEDSSTDFSGSSVLAGFLTLVSNGAITDDANADISAGGAASFTATGANITLGDQAGNDINFAQLTLNGVNATVTEDSGTDFTGSSVLTGFLSLISNGDITDDANADINVTGNARFAATTAITLGDQAGNDINFGSLTVGSAASATITEDSGTDFEGITIVGGGGLTIVSAGDITDQVGVTISVAGPASLTATGGSITLGDDNSDSVAFGKLTLNGVNASVNTKVNPTVFTGSSVLTGFLVLRSAGISDDAGVTISVAGNASLTTQSGGSITLGDNGGDTVDFGSLTLNTINATVTEDSATDFAGSSTLTGFLNLTSAGDITDQSGVTIAVTGNASFNAGTGSITLGDNVADTINFGSLTVNGANGTVTEDSATVFSGSSTLTGFLALISNGAITDDANADISVTANASFNAGANDITIGDNGANNDVNFGSLTLNGATVAVTEDSAMEIAGATATTSLTLFANGHVTQTAIITSPILSVTVTPATVDLTDILLGMDNNVSGAVTFAEANADALRDVLWRNVSATAQWPTLPATATINDLTVQHTMTGINITAALTLKDLAGDSGDLNLLAGNGSITQTGGSTLTIPGTTTLSASGDITLTEANDFDSAGLVAGDGVVTIVDGDNVSINDINNIIIDASDATTANTLVSLIVTANAGAGTIFIEDSDFGTATAVTITTVNNQTYNGNIILEQDTVMNSTASGTISFSGTINSDAGISPRSLEVNTAGLTQFNGLNVGNVAPLSSLTTDSVASGILGGNTELTGNFFTTAFQLHRDTVILKSDVSINTTAATFNQTVNGDGAVNGQFSLTINDTAGTGSATSATFNGAVGTGSGTSALEFLTVNADTINLNGGAVTTSSANGGTGNQTYNGAVVLNATANTTTLTGVDITFQGTVRSLTANEETLTVSGTGVTTFNGAVGDNSQALNALTVNNGGTTAINGGIINTLNNQTYLDAVLIGDPDGTPAGDDSAGNFLTQAAAEANTGYLNSRTILTSASSGTIQFGSTINDDATAGEAHLIINTTGITRFDGLIGNTAPLSTLLLGPSGAVKDATFNTGDETHINSTATHTTPTTAGQLDAVTKVTNIRTVGFQTYNDDIKLAPASEVSAANADVILRAGAGAAVTIANRVDGDVHNQQGLTVFADQIDISTAEIGVLVQLEFLDISAGPSGIQNLDLTSNFEVFFNAGLVVLGTVEANGFDLTITADDITFAGGPNSVMAGNAGTPANPNAELIMRPLSTVVAMNIGSTVDVPGTFSLSDSDLAALADGWSAITIGRFDGANPITVDSSTFRDPVRIQAPAAGGTINVIGNIVSTATLAEAQAAADNFAEDRDAANATITVDAFGLGVGMFPTDGAGVLFYGPDSTTFLAANITTAGTAIQFTDAVQVTGNSILDTTAGGGVAAGADIIFDFTTNDDGNGATGSLLILNAGTAGDIDFRGAIGNTAPISSLSILSARDVDVDSTMAVGSFTQTAGTGTTVLRGDVTTTAVQGVNITATGITLGDDGDASMADATPNFSGDGAANGITVTTGGNAARFNGPVALAGGNIVVTAGAGTITFENTINGAQNLTANSTATTTFAGLVGGTTPLTSVTTDAGGTTAINGAGVTTTADQLYNDNVTLGVAAVTLNGVNVTFNGTLDGPAALVVNASGVTTFGDAAGDSVGAGTALLSLTTDAAGSTTINAAIVTTSGAQIYNDAVTLGNTVTSTGSTVTFNQTVNAAAAGVQGLAVTGNAVFGDGGADAVGGTAALASLTVSGNTTFNSTAAVDVTTTGNQIYGDNAAIDAITLSADTTLSGSSITFNSTIDGAFVFTVNAAATTQFNGVVGGSTPLTSLTTDDFGGAGTFDPTFLNASSFSAGVIAFNDPVGIQVNVTVNGTTSVTFGSSIGSTATEFNDLAINSPTTTFGGPVGTVLGAGGDSLGSLTVSGAVVINGGNINTEAFAGHSGNQSYGGAATIGAGTTLTAGGTLLFSSTLNGAFDLTLAVTGSSTFVGAVGGGTPIGDGTGSAIIINSAGATEFQSTVNTASGITQAGGAGAVTFRDNVTIAAGDTASTFNANVILDGLTFTSGGAVTFGDAAADVVTLSGSAVTLAVTGTTTANAIVNGNQDLIINSTGSSQFNAAVGGAVPATEIGDGTGAAITIGAGAGPVTFASTVRVKSGITQDGTAGLVIFRDNVTVAAGDTASTFNGNVTLDGLVFDSARGVTFGDAATDTVTLSSGDVTLAVDEATVFNALVDGAQDLIINSVGITVFNAAVGSGTAIGDATGASIAIGAGAGAVTFNTTLQTATGITQDGTAGLVTFDGDVNIVGAGTATVLNGNVTLDGLTFTSAGAVTFGDAGTDTLTLSEGNVTLAITGITTVNAATDGAFDLVINSTGGTTFNAPVGFNTAIGDGTGASIAIGAGAGAVTFNSTVRTATGITQDGTAGLLTFVDNVNILGANTDTTLSGSVTLDGLTLTSVGVITIGDAAADTLTLSGGDVTVTSTGAGAAGNVTFNATITGAQNLAVNTAGTTAFNGPVGTPAALLSVTTDAAGTTTIAGGSVNTTGNQIYNDVLTLGAGTTLTAGGNLVAAQTLDGSFDLILAVTGSSTFTGAVGAGAAIGDGAGAAITINSTGATEFQSTVNTASGIVQSVGAGTVTFRDNVTIAAGDTASTFNESVVLDGLTLISGGAVTLGDAAADVVTLSGSSVTLAVTGTTTVNAIVNGNQDLIINSTGSSQFNAAVGGTLAATEIGDGTGAAITIGAGAGPVTFVSTVRVKSGITQDGTAGLVTFQDDVTVAAGDTASTFNGNVTLDGLTFTTAKAVTFGDATTDTVTLSTADVTITATSSGADGAVTFNSAVDGAVALTVNTAGATTFNGVVGPNITTLTTDATGTTTINTATVGGAVLDFNDAVILETSTTLTGATSVDFGSTLDSAAGEANDLTVNSPVTGFHGVVGGTVGGALGTLNTDAAGTTTLDTTAITAAEVDFNDAIVVDQNLVITGTTSIDFASTVNSQVAENNDLTLNSPVTGFHGIVGALNPLGTLSTDAVGTTTLDTTAISAAVVDFNDAVIVDQNLTINGTTSIDFASTLDSQALENNDLTLNSPVTGFHGIVGGTRPLGTLNTDVVGTTTLDTTAITVAVADFNDAVVVDQNLTIIGTTSIDFASTLNSQVLENNDLTLNSPDTQFHGIVGAASPFGTLSTDAVGTTTIDTTSVTAANVDFNDAILLTQDVVINGTATIDFASTVNSSGAARDLTLNSPSTTFHGVVGGVLALDVLSTDAAGTTTIDTTTVNAAVVDFNDAIVLSQDVTINGTTSIDFASTINSTGGARDLTLNSPVTGFHGVVGGTAVLDVLTTDAAGTTTIDTTAINAAVIDFNDAILVDVGSVLTGTTSVDFALTVNSQVGEANDLTVNSPTTGFHGIVGGTTPLNTLTTDAAGTTTIDTTAITADVVDFNDAILLSQDVVIIGTTSVDFASTVNSSGGARDLTVNSPVTAFHGIVGGVSPLDVLTTDAAGTTTIDTTAISGATLDFNDAVTLSQNVVLTGTTTVDFATTVNSDLIATPRTLLVVSPLTIFGGAVGGSVPLASLTTDASGGANLTRINGGSVTTTGDQTYNDTVRLGADTILTGNDITFATLLDSSEGALRSLTVNSTSGGITTFNGAVGTLDRLAHLETNTDGRTDIAGGLINLNGASALFNDPVLLLADLTINEAGVGSVTFNNTLNGAFNLVVNSDGLGATIFNGIVGGITPLTSITTDADGTTQINGGTVTTTGFQIYNDPVTIGANTVLNSTGAGNITFVTTLDGPFTLLVNTAGITTFGGPVGSITPLNSVTTDAPGSTSINGGSVLTFGTQTYNDPVNLGANTIITSTGAAALGNVTFNSTVNGAFTLLVNTAGATTFNGAVGNTAPLVSLTTDAPGTVAINGGAVSTTTTQTYNDAATIGANTVLTSTGVGAAGNITFAQTLDGAFTLNVNTAGATIFNGVVGGITPLVSVVTDAPGTTQVNGTAVTTTGIQTYNDTTTVGADTTFTSTGAGAAGNITFNGTLDDDAVAGAANVIVNTAGATTFNAPVGGVTPLTSLTTDAPGTVAINGGLVTTVNNQTYNDPATLGADTVLNSLAAGNITFNQTLDDDGLAVPTSNLIVNTAGITTFTGVVGGIAPLTSITTDFGGTLGDITAINGGAVTTTGFQLYNDHVTLGQDTTLTSTTVGNITIGMPNPPVPWGPTTLRGTGANIDLIAAAIGGNVQINAAVSAVDTINGQAVATFIGANPANTGIILYYSLPNSPFVFIYTAPPASFNLNNKIYSLEEIFGRDVPNLFKYPGDAKEVASDISVLLSTNRVENLIGVMPTDKILTSYDLAAIEEARKNR